jgi:hypothetical protein
VLCAPCEAALAAACAPGQLEARLAAIDATSRPGSQAGPTDVAFGLMLIDLLSVDEVRQRFRADFRLELAWRDPRLAADSLGCDAADAHLPLASLWHPEILLMNGIDVKQSMRERAVIEADGGVRLIQRYAGTFSTPMALADFPLETQPLVVRLGTALLGPDQVRVRDEPERSGVLGATTVAGWSVEEPRFEAGTARIADLTINQAAYAFPTQRRPGYFLYKVVLPLALIVAMSWSVFFIDPKHIDGQLGVASASVLTAIAFQLSFGDVLPQIPYLTRMDYFVMGSTVLVIAALAEVVWTSSLTTRDRTSTARRLDRLSRYGFPLVYGVYTLWCFLV